MDRTSPRNGNVIELDSELQRRIEEFAQVSGKTTADIVREAFEEYLTNRNASKAAASTDQPTSAGETLYDRALRAGLIGCLDGLPPDLSTNKAYFEGFGRD